MIRALLVAGLLVAGFWWLFGIIASQPGNASISWGSQLVEMTTTTLVAGVLLFCLVFYALLRGLFYLAGLKKHLTERQQKKRVTQANASLTQGLIQLAEGHWPEAEQELTRHAEYSEAPLLNYLTAARAAHMQHKPAQRDELLRKAIASDNQARIAVGVSQAEMQLSDSQFEQAHATLLNLRKLAPQNSYILKLYAKTLLRQEHWEQLLELLPELVQHDLLDNDSKNMRHLKTATLRGVFAKYVNQQQSGALQACWQKIPHAIAEQAETQWLYATALHQAGDDMACAAFVEKHNNLHLREQLTGLYGRLQHQQLSAAIEQAQRWLDVQPENPANLLLLARLHCQQQQWETAKAYYIASLNQAPDAEAYLELAGMLETLGGYEAAAQCYRLGLRYNIRGIGERLDFATADYHSSQPPLKVASQ